MDDQVRKTPVRRASTSVRDRDNGPISRRNLRVLLGRKDSNLQSPDSESGQHAGHLAAATEHNIGGQQTTLAPQSGELSAADRLVVAFARSGLRFGELIVQTFGEAPHPPGAPCLYTISDSDLASALERTLDDLDRRGDQPRGGD